MPVTEQAQFINGKTIQCGGQDLSDEQKKIANKDDSVFVIYDGQLIGSLNVSDTVRPEAKEDYLTA